MPLMSYLKSIHHMLCHPMLSSRSFMVLCFTFRFMIHFELIFMKWVGIQFSHMGVQLFQHHSLKRLTLLYLLYCLFLLLKISCPYLCSYISGHSILSYWPNHLLSHRYHAVLITIVKSLSRVQLFVAPWTIDYQASPSMGFSRQEYWSGLPFPSSFILSLKVGWCQSSRLQYLIG